MADSEPEMNMFGFLFGDADYLEQDARDNLGNLAQIEGLANIQEDYDVDQAEGGEDQDGFQRAPDAQDYADESELIEDETPEAEDDTAAKPANGFAVVGAAMAAAGQAAAEEEDYDFDEMDEDQPVVVAPTTAAAAASSPATVTQGGAPLVPTISLKDWQPQQQQQQHQVPPAATKNAVPPPQQQQFPAVVAPQQQLIIQPPPEPVTAANQSHIAESRGIQLPVLRQQQQSGDKVLSFLSLFVPTTQELLPPPRLPRVQLVKDRAAGRGPPVDQAELQPVVQDVSLLKAPQEQLVKLGYTLQPADEEAEEEVVQNRADDKEVGKTTAAAGGVVKEGGDKAGKEKGKEAEKKKEAAVDKKAEVKEGDTAQKKQLPRVRPSSAQAQQQQPSSPQSPLYPSLPDEVFDNPHQLEWERGIIGLARKGMADLQIVEFDSDEETTEHLDNNNINVVGGDGSGGGAGMAVVGGAGMVVDPTTTGGDGIGGVAAMDMFSMQQQQQVLTFGGNNGFGGFGLPQLQQQPQVQIQIQQQQQQQQQPIGGGGMIAQQPTELPGTVHFDPQGFNPWSESAANNNNASGNGGSNSNGFTSSSSAAVNAITRAGELTAASASSGGPLSQLGPAVPLLRIPEGASEVSEAVQDQLRRAGGRVYPGGINGIQWEGKIIWIDGEEARQKLASTAPWLDLNDSKLVFELMSKRPLDSNLKKGAATLVPHLPKVATNQPKGADAADAAAAALARINISKDREYLMGPKKKHGAVAKGAANAKFAADLSTVPLSVITLQEQITDWHKPRGLWWPTRCPAFTPARRQADGNVVVILSLPGRQKKFTNVDFYMEGILGQCWDKAVAAKMEGFKDAEGKDVTLVKLFPNGRAPRIIPMDPSPIASGAVDRLDNKLHIVAVFKDITLLSTDVMDAPPEDANTGLLRPPWAFSKKSELSAEKPGRVVLLEYLESSPPLLARPGMGAKLVTYYRKKDDGDTEHLKMKEEAAESNDRWKVGHIVGLGEHDESPFLGQVSPGKSQLSVESGLFTAPAASYDARPSDFLLIRSQTGVMSLREVAGTITVGQELPLHRIPAPQSRDMKDLEERRLYVYVFRHLRIEQQRMDRRGPFGARAGISIKSLMRLFPNRPQSMIVKFLRESCGLTLINTTYQGPRGPDEDIYGVKPGVRLPSDVELKKKMLPEEACALEAGIIHSYKMPTKNHDKFNNVAVDKLRLAAEMLPDDPDTKLAVKMVEHAMQTAPWNLTDTFVTAFREGRAIMQLQGAADPTARGLGYSFLRDIRHKTMDPTKAGGGAKPAAGGIQGTDADLRRMTAEQAREKLRSFGMGDEETKEMGRWDLIGLVRRLSTAAAADGMGEAVKYARTHKTTILEQQKRYTKRAQEIFEKQIGVLNNTAAEDLGDPDALEAELEAMLAAEFEDSDDEGRKKAKEEEDEAAALEQMRAEGLLGSPSAPRPSQGTTAAGAAAGPSTAPGGGTLTTTTAAQAKTTLPDGTVLIPGQTRRIRRVVLVETGRGQWVKEKELIYMGRERPFMLASLYADATGFLHHGPFGFGKREIKHKKGTQIQRLGYNAARGRGMIRGGRGGRRGGGRGSRGGRSRSVAYSSPTGGGGGRGRASTRRKRKRDVDEYVDLSDSEEDDFNDILSEEDDEFDPDREAMIEEGLFMDYELPKAKPKRPAVPREPKPKVPRKPKAPKPPKREKTPPIIVDEPLPDFDLDLALQQQPSPTTAAAAKLKLKNIGGGGTSPPLGSGLEWGAPPVRRAARAASPYMYDDHALDELLGPEDPSPTAPAVHGGIGGGDYVAEFRFTPDAEEVKDELYNPAADIYEHQDDEDSDPDEVFGQPSRGGRRRSGVHAYQAPAPITTRRGVFYGAHQPQPPAPTTRRNNKRSGGGKKSKGRRGGDFDESDDDDDDDFVSEFELTDEEDYARPKSRARSTAAPPAKKSKTTHGGFCGGGGKAPPRSKGIGPILVDILKKLQKASDDHIKATKKTAPKGTRADANTYWYTLAKPVVKKFAPDYNVFVPVQNEMWLDKVRSKANTGKYSTVDEFLADIYQIRDNAVAYNSPGCGQHAFPPALELSVGMVAWIEEALSKRQSDLAAAEFGFDAAPALPRAPSRKLSNAGGGGGFARAASHAVAHHRHAAPAVVDEDIPDFDVGEFEPPPPAAAAPVVEEFQFQAPNLVTADIPAPPAAAGGNGGDFEEFNFDDGGGVAPVVGSQITWVECTQCRKWRNGDGLYIPPGSQDYWVCSMKAGFTCDTPLEPGADQ